MKSLSFLIILIISFFSCRRDKEPQACFIMDKGTVVLNEVISFKDCSINSDNVEWSFDDSEDASIKNPTHKFEEIGNYEVVQTVYNESGDKHNLTQNIDVKFMGIEQINIITQYNTFALSYIIRVNDISYLLEKKNDNLFSNTISEITPLTNNISFFYIREISVPQKYFNFHFNFYNTVDYDTMLYKFKISDDVECEVKFKIID